MENTRFQAVKDFDIPLSATLSKYHNKIVRACKVKNKPINLHGGATSERSTVLVEIIIDSVILPSFSCWFPRNKNLNLAFCLFN